VVEEVEVEEGAGVRSPRRAGRVGVRGMGGSRPPGGPPSHRSWAAAPGAGARKGWRRSWAAMPFGPEGSRPAGGPRWSCTMIRRTVRTPKPQ